MMPLMCTSINGVEQLFTNVPDCWVGDVFQCFPRGCFLWVATPED